MLKPLLFDTHAANNYLQNNDYVTLTSCLRDAFKLEKSNCGAPVQYEFSEEAINCLEDILKTIFSSKFNEDVKNLTRELFRSLRNYVVNQEVQNYLTNNSIFLSNVNYLLEHIQQSSINDILQVILQFLINLTVSNTVAAQKVFAAFSNNIFTLLKKKTAIYETSALLYNVSVHKSLDNDLSLDNYVSIFEIFEANSNVEFLQFLLEKFVSYDQFWIHFKNFDLSHRIITLEIIRHLQIENQDLSLPITGITVMVDQFIKSGNIIFQTVKSSDSDLEPYEISQLLEVISSSCGNENNLKLLQCNKDLLINSGVLLINVHQLGKQSDNNFTAIQKLGEITVPSLNICQHPAFGFKASLVRLIGNLCWKNKEMQDLVREADLIPVILDCCNIDARNPFIMQWVILATRNLCENNYKNQEIIAGMHQQGTISSSTLEEMGLRLHSDNGTSLQIVSLEALQK